MSKRKPLDKEQLRERRNKLLEAAAKAELSLTEGVREMRAISGMTQEDFARHRGVSARVVKALELGQGNPTVATLNRIGQFFGLEVAFVPVRRGTQVPEQQLPADVKDFVSKALAATFDETLKQALNRKLDEMAAELIALERDTQQKLIHAITGLPFKPDGLERMPPENSPENKAVPTRKTKERS